MPALTASSRGDPRRKTWAIALTFTAWLAGCSGGGSDSVSTPPPPPPADTTPPLLSTVSASAGIDTAEVTWNTDEPADGRVEFGTTTGYGGSSSAAPTLATVHVVTLTGLMPATTYHYRVSSRDAAGNLATGGDRTFATTAPPDVMAPTVTLTSPIPGATVSGTTTVTADANDDVGVAGVRFSIDAATIGSEDVTAPFSVSWDTTAVSDGTHDLTATARDAAGNSSISAAVRVVVDNATPDSSPPSVSLTAPSPGTTVLGVVTLSASATDNVGVVGVTFRLDGTAIGIEDATAPYTIQWDSRTVLDGPHTVAATARDSAGNVGLSPSISITVDNDVPVPGGAITVGSVEIDRPTIQTLGFSLPVLSGDTNYNAVATISYRPAGDVAWRNALPMLRVRPDTLSNEDPTPFNVAEQFAGSIFDLSPDTLYEIEIGVQDPDGGSTTRTAAARTRPPPASDPRTAVPMTVSTLGQLQSALNTAAPGSVITLAEGTYTGAITISTSGTPEDPIFLRGQSREGTILDASGAGAGITVSGSYVTVEDMTVRNSNWGMRLVGSSSIVVRRMRLNGILYGIDARGGIKRDFYICDNLLAGDGAVWPATGSSVWDYEGIVITGEGHVVCHNTLSGFGDALGLHHTTAIPNRAIDFSNNEVLWTGDNGIELDFTDRNVRAIRNRISNGGNHSISFQPVWGGPAYAIRNVMYNSAYAPYKLNNDPTGIFILHNTAVRPGWAWQQTAGVAANLRVANNIFVGTTNAVDMTTVISLAHIDYNGWAPDGQFRFTDTWGSFADLQARSPYEAHGVLLDGQPFAIPLSIPPAYSTLVAPIDPALRAGSNAVDAASRLPNINDAFDGADPDLGAIELNTPAPTYGVRW